ncbi:MAG TPA: AbrB/MazE/SpoVT family DNA-binding domain-containing protein [Chloroflexota bacterium]|nr:AbrB/MazE/SpoVT family DNA-binding domain-containing protein [Chloroflexota bacterium]
MSTVKVSAKNQIAVPAAVRKRLGIKPGDRLRIEIKGKKAILEREEPVARRDVLTELLELAPEIWQGIDTTAYIEELRNEWSHREP